MELQKEIPDLSTLYEDLKVKYHIKGLKNAKLVDLLQHCKDNNKRYLMRIKELELLLQNDKLV